ncbi:hypothetical protein L227DRAFT_95663 [Lentinus tigrinus ALCF2SS1-6]|uniref:Secreted protein n=1 Tax=Lentinus tigrinus ALCF2SS1-6 TaxID=1328759 RepID=A0A5C2S8V9_9APHY|nr:hypothetical protein L227DRAFT_95663 [Lentinus tigrinus ALCF2SS1-6]
MSDPAGHNPTSRASLWLACTAALYLDAVSYTCPTGRPYSLLSLQSLSVPLLSGPDLYLHLCSLRLMAQNDQYNHRQGHVCRCGSTPSAWPNLNREGDLVLFWPTLYFSRPRRSDRSVHA